MRFILAFSCFLFFLLYTEPGEGYSAKPTLRFSFWYLFKYFSFLSKWLAYCYYFFFFSFSWGYRNVFEQYSSIINRKYPDLVVMGDLYPPPEYRVILARCLVNIRPSLLFYPSYYISFVLCNSYLLIHLCFIEMYSFIEQ